MTRWRVEPAGPGSLFGCHLDGIGKSPRRVPDAEPAIAEAAGALDRRV
jgi:hypothetical protein